MLSIHPRSWAARQSFLTMRRTEAQRRNARPERLSQATDRSDNPALRDDHEPSRRIGALDDLDLDLAADTAQSGLELRPLVATVGIELAQERAETEQHAHEQHVAVAVLDVSGVDDGVHQ